MRKIILASALVLATSTGHADVGAFVGISYVFGPHSGLGISLMATSSREQNRWIGAAGVSFYPFSTGRKFGITIGAGYQGKNAAGLMNIDVLQRAPALSLGYVNTQNKHQDTLVTPETPTPTPVTPPDPTPE